MTITRYEITLIPNTEEGKAFAEGYERRSKEQGSFEYKNEDAEYIGIQVKYVFDIKGESD